MDFRGVVQCDGYSAYRALAAARRYIEALAQARSQLRRRELLEDLLQVLTAGLLPLRPGRREPRAVKRWLKPYSRLMNHRDKFLEIPQQIRYRLDKTIK